MSIQDLDIEKDLNVELEREKLKRANFTTARPISSTATPAMAKATTIVQLNETIEGLQKNIEEMQGMIRVVEEIKKRLV